VDALWDVHSKTYSCAYTLTLHNAGSNEDEQRIINNLKVIIACNKAECFVRSVVHTH
jgi:hypothetical protein